MSSLNIKNEATVELIRSLSVRRGVPMTRAVHEAVRAQLEVDARPGRAALAEWLKGVVQETAPLMNDGRSSAELFDELYDPTTGLPR